MTRRRRAVGHAGQAAVMMKLETGGWGRAVPKEMYNRNTEVLVSKRCGFGL